MLSENEVKTILSDKEFEIVDGKPKKRNFGEPSRGRIQASLGAEIYGFVEKSNLGEVYSSTHFAIGKDFYAPSIAFVAFDNFPESGEPQGFWNIAPDLAVEIVLQTDDSKDVLKKIGDYFAAGVKRVWIVEPNRKTISVYTSPTQVQILTENDELICEEILPNFRLKLTEIFHAPKKAAAS